MMTSKAELIAHIDELVEYNERLIAENSKLKEGLLEALEWNWCDEDFPESLYHELSTLAGGEGLPGLSAASTRHRATADD